MEVGGRLTVLNELLHYLISFNAKSASRALAHLVVLAYAHPRQLAILSSRLLNWQDEVEAQRLVDALSQLNRRAVQYLLYGRTLVQRIVEVVGLRELVADLMLTVSVKVHEASVFVQRPARVVYCSPLRYRRPLSGVIHMHGVAQDTVRR